MLASSIFGIVFVSFVLVNVVIGYVLSRNRSRQHVYSSIR